MTTRRRVLVGGGLLASGLAGYALGHSQRQTRESSDSLEFGTAEIQRFTATPDGRTVDEYAGFSIRAIFETGTEADRYSLPTIYVVDTAVGTVDPQVPGEYFNPDLEASYEMDFLLPEIEEPTTVVVHMGGEASRFEVRR